MEKRRRIVLYGNSVIMGTVGASLGRLSPYEVITLLPARQSELAALEPDVVVFDLEGAEAQAAFALLGKAPHLLVIGVSPDSNLVRVWSGRQLHELSTRDLLGVIDDQLPRPESSDPVDGEQRSSQSRIGEET